MNETKLNFIQNIISTYYKAGGSTLPSAYKSAVLDMIDMIAYGEIETDEDSAIDTENISLEEIENMFKAKMSEFRKEWEKYEPSQYNFSIPPLD